MTDDYISQAIGSGSQSQDQGDDYISQALGGSPQKPFLERAGDFLKEADYLTGIPSEQLLNTVPGMPTVKGNFHKNLESAPYQGEESDAYYGRSLAGDVLDAFGQGAKKNWGMAEEDEKQLLDGIHDQATKEKLQASVKGGNETFSKSAASAVSSFYEEYWALAAMGIFKPVAAVMGGIQGALGTAATAAKESNIPGSGGAAELLGGASEGAVLPDMGGMHGILELGRDIREQKLTSMLGLYDARSKGVIGEGETGFYDIGPVSTKDQQARIEAQERLGINNKILPKMPEEQPPAMPEVDDLARQINPDAFKQWDKLLDIQDNLHRTRQYLEGQFEYRGEELPETPGNLKTAASLDQVREHLQGIDEQLRDLIPDTSAARNRVHELLESESPEGSAYRDYVQAQALENAIRLQELSPDVTRTFQHARSLLTEGQSEVKRKPQGASQKAPQAEPAGGTTPSTRQPGTGPGGASKGSEPPSTVGPRPGAEAKVAGGADRALQEAVARGMAEPEWASEGLPGYESMAGKTKDAMDKAAAYVVRNPEEALDVIRGNINPPADIPAAYVLKAVKEKAELTNDLDLSNEFIRSPLHGQASQEASNLRLRRDLYDQDDPMRLLKALYDDAINKAGGLRATARLERLKTNLKAIGDSNKTPSLPEFQSFLKAIQCE